MFSTPIVLMHLRPKLHIAMESVENRPRCVTVALPALIFFLEIMEPST